MSTCPVCTGPAGRDILERILAITGAELSATRTIARNLKDATSLAWNLSIRGTLTADAATRRWLRILGTETLAPDRVTTIGAAPAARGALISARRQGENAGHPRDAVRARLIAARPVGDPADPAADVAAVLHDRISTWLDAQNESTHHDDTSVPPQTDVSMALIRPPARSLSSAP